MATAFLANLTADTGPANRPGARTTFAGRYQVVRTLKDGPDTETLLATDLRGARLW